MNDRYLQMRLRPLARRQRALRLRSRLALCWLATALIAVTLTFLLRSKGVSATSILPILALAGLASGLWLARRHRRAPADWHALALAIETRHPDLDGRLLTAVEQQTPPEIGPGFLQRRLVDETIRHSRTHDWTEAIPRSRVVTAGAANLLAFVLLAFVFLSLRSLPPPEAPRPKEPAGLTLTPGDVALERGESLVVIARFGGSLPSAVDLVLDAAGEDRRIPMVKSLSDPFFGGTVPDVTNSFLYRLEYADHRTRDHRVTVFEHPRLERADAAVTYPDYTRLPPQRIGNTRRVTAVEGSRLDLALQFNKPVASARLVAKNGDGAAFDLLTDTNRPTARIEAFPLTITRTYDLQLVDRDGRTNKTPAQLVFSVLTNRAPELKLASPRGDSRPSPLEEIPFEGQVWDDFGVVAYGLSYTVVGQDTRSVELGQAVHAKEQRAFQHLLRLEELDVEPDQLVVWHVWADDIGPDGQPRRTMGDLFFAEIRPFDEVFREGQSGESQAQQEQAGNEPSEGQGRPSTRLAELQKQIVSATWKLQRDQAARAPATEASAGNDDSANVPDAVGGEARDAIGQDDRKTATNTYAQDVAVVRDSQAQALEQAQTAREAVEDPRTASFWQTAVERMEDALDRLDQAMESPDPLPQALTSEQAAYQALLRLQQREYEVARNRRGQRNQQAGSRQNQMQRQLDQLDLTQSDDRYETERQAQAPQSPERREQLQVLNRLQELARRQQDLNERLRELQTALDEARTEPEREEIRRQLKRLEDEQQQMLADADELRERMERPENQSRLAEQRRQMDQARQDMQRAAEAASQGAVSQALASGTRAQRQIEQTRDDLRRESAGEFAEDLRAMRGDARDLARHQAEIEKQLDALADPQRRTLSDTAERNDLLERLARQKNRLTNVIESATQLSQQTEAAEPLVSRELYDSLRKFSQDEAGTVQQIQEELIDRGILTQRTYDRLRGTAEHDGAKALEVTAEMLRQGFLPQADRAEERARGGITDLRRGIERAAERLLGDDAEELRLAQRELDAITGALEREIARANQGPSNVLAQAGGPPAEPGDQRAPAEPSAGQDQPGRPSQAERAQAGQPADQASAPQRDTQSDTAPTNPRTSRDPESTGTRSDAATGLFTDTLDRLFDRSGPDGTGPLTGEDFAPWSDRLREVEELVDLPSLRSDIAQARERARRMRVEYKRDFKKPDWAVVRLEIVNPLIEVRRQIAEELARREPGDTLAPIDRDPVPSRFSDLVRRYYEDLGRNKSEDAR
ncbi:MAG TPA: hypothetical protein P5534_11170 [Candidatus Paceibacterota bacterium]|nr:hypothetical protein [Candidatus Paceibacterota bacterium]